ncbi:hypothetical protein Lal_00020115 [Lupinus albus]|nr:hypothetical protein Lal_00020115 [Lupinus albus]
MRKKSPWVRDLASITPRVTNKSNWFWGNITRHIGNGHSTSFWHDIWLGVSNLSTRYRRLFSINLLPHGNISDFGSWEGDTWEWNFSWRRNFFTLELDIVNTFFDELKQVSLQLNKTDSWEWKLEKTKQYSVRSAYRSITLPEASQPKSSSTKLTHTLWRSKAPLKVTYFAWRLFQDRIPTKDALSRKGVTAIGTDGILCSFCREHSESSHHLFSSCSFTFSVWQLVYNWLGISIVLHHNTSTHFLNHMGLVKDKKCYKVWSVVWLATVWAIWLSRNDLIFNSNLNTPQQILDSARVKSWFWIKNQNGMDFTTPYCDWVANPLACLNATL